MILVRLGQVLLVQVSVDLRGGDIGMAKELLNHSQVRSAFEQVSGEGVAQEVRVDLLGQSCHGCSLFHDLSHAIGGELAPSHGEKDVGGAFP